MNVEIPDLAHHNAWRDDGYCLFPKFFDVAALRTLTRGAEEVANWPISDDRWMMWFEKTRAGERIVSKVENFLDDHASLRGLLLDDMRIANLVSALVGERVRRLKELLIFKYPDSGGFRPHQDIYHVPHGLPQRIVHAVAAVALDDADASNGGLCFSPGQHQRGVLPMDANGVMDPSVAEALPWSRVDWSAGDLFVFDDHAPHYSLPNLSGRARRVIYLVFQRASTLGPTRAEYNSMKRAYNPPEGKAMDLDNLRPSNGIFYRDGS